MINNKQVKKRYWLRGGVIGLVLGIISFIFGLIVILNCPIDLMGHSTSGPDMCESQIFILGAPYLVIWLYSLVMLISLQITITSMIQFFVHIFSLLLLFGSTYFLGSLIGWIYGKIKEWAIKNNQLINKYNPFTMWSSWTGTGIGILIVLIFSIPNIRIDGFNAINWMGLILYSIIGFLLGWAIHSLIRSFRK
ncbi:MAG: hypothetical protein V1788_00350 [Nanoarchaeota archaeon]